MKGYHQLILQSEWNGFHGGIIGMDYISYGINPTTFSGFNGDVVLLADGLEHLYAADGSISAALSVSAFNKMKGKRSKKIELTEQNIREMLNPDEDGNTLLHALSAMACGGNIQ